jgi:hypothetical protein
MLSLRGAVENARLRKKVPQFKPGYMLGIAQGLAMSFPVSIKDFVVRLDGLAPASVTSDSGPRTAGFVHGSAYLFLQSDGGIAWGGKVHESGVVGDHFRFAVALLDVKDAAGNVLVFVHEDTLAGQVDIGFSDKEWNDFGVNQLVKDNWAQVRSTRFDYRLHASTDALQVVETVFIAAAIVVGAIAAGDEASRCPEGSHWKCGWIDSGKGQQTSPGNPNNPPSRTAMFECHCEPD